MNAPDAGLPIFQAPFAQPDEELATGFLARAGRDRAAESRIDARAKKLIEAIRARSTGLGGVEDFLHAYSLSTKEGLALMVLAEALLRVPDAATADRLIEDKLAAGRWLDSDVRVRHRTQSGRAEHAPPLRHRAGGHNQYGGGRGQCLPIGAGRVNPLSRHQN
jgi:hypothetical protein